MRTAAALAPLMSSDRMDWNTPAEVLDIVRAFDDIALDPATCASNPTSAVRAWTGAPIDGLVESWFPYNGPGIVYVNPPYGRALPAWAAKIHAEGQSGSEIIALLPARPDTRWFQAHVTKADALCFWKGRITFVGAPHAAPFPSVVAYFGERAKKFRAVFGPQGWIP